MRILNKRPNYHALLPVFDDSKWTQTSLSTVDFSYPIQAIRIPFTISIKNANALELSIDYSCGIQIYGNGFLLFQDNVDSFDGNATGCYREHHRHLLLMSTQVFTLQTNMLAIVLYQSNRQTVNNYLALTLSLSIPSSGDSCYSVPYDYSIALICGDQRLSIPNKSSITIPHLSCSLVLSFSDITIQYEGIRFSLSDPIHSIDYFEVFTSRNITTSRISETRLLPSQPCIEDGRMTFFFPCSDLFTNVLILKSIKTRSYSIHLSSMELLICSYPPPSSLTFSTEIFFGYVGVTSFDITPLEPVTNCTIQPSLPKGLWLDSLGCRIVGVAESPVHETFILSIQQHSIQGKFSLNIGSCESHILRVIRYYRKQPQLESWVMERSEVDSWIQVLGEGLDEEQKEIDECEWRICAKPGKYRVTVSSVLPEWNDGSFLLVYDITEQKQLLQIRYDSHLASASMEYVYVGISPHSTSHFRIQEKSIIRSDPQNHVRIDFYTPFFPTSFNCSLDEVSIDSSYPFDWVPNTHSFSVSMDNVSLSYDLFLPIRIYRLTCYTMKSPLFESSIPPGIKVLHGNEDIILGMSSVSSSQVHIIFTNLLAFTTKDPDLEWKVVSEAPAGWQVPSFDDSNWSIVHFQSSSSLGYMDSTSVYIRHSFLIPSLTTFITLNIAATFQGGLIAWVNGHRIAMFHVTEESDGTFIALDSLHSLNSRSLFHVVLLFSAAVQGLNVLAIQLVYPIWLHSFPIHFSAIASFGVIPIALCTNSFVSISTSIAPITTTKGCGFHSSGLIDKDLTTACVYRLSHRQLTLHWELENRVGGRFSHIEFVHNQMNITARWRFYQYPNQPNMRDEGYLSLQSFTDSHSLSLQAHSYPSSTVINALDLDIVEAEKILAISQVYLTYHHTTTVLCPALSPFDSVVSGGISMAPCPDNQIGTMKRVCVDGILSDIDSSDCVLAPPTNLLYSQDVYSLVLGVSISLAPFYNNLITKFSIDERSSLPEGLKLNSQTGYISGTPTKVVKDQNVVIYGSNENGVCSCSLSFSTHIGMCTADGIFPETRVGVTITIPCSSKGKFVGTISRTCQIGVSEGEWSHQRGICIPILLVVVIGCSIACLVVILLVLCIRTYGRMKSKLLAQRMMYCIKEDMVQ